MDDLHLQDYVQIQTPEGIDLDLQLAGLGSRFFAQLLDLLVFAAVMTAVLVVLAAIATPLTGYGDALATIVLFLLLLGYPIAWERYAGGQTPGKRMAGLRVLRADGTPVDLLAATTRSVTRLVDGPPTLYVPSIVFVLATKLRQRPGDILAGTIVVRAPRRSHPTLPATPPAPVPAPSALLDLTGVGSDEQIAAAAFLERRAALKPQPRQRLAAQLAGILRPHLGAQANGIDDERLIETVVASRRPGARGQDHS